MSPIYLRSHSYFGILESLVSPKDLIHRAKEYGISALGLTDHLYITGTTAFYEACREANIKPILGLEIDLTDQEYMGRVTLLAKNQEGWANLSRLSSSLLVQKEPISIQGLCERYYGLICILGGPKGILRELLAIPSALKHQEKLLSGLQNVFNKDLYIEIQRYSSGPLKNEANLIQTAKEFSIPIIATQDIRYLEKTDLKTFQTITAIRKNTTVQNLSKSALSENEMHFPYPEDFLKRYQDLPETIENLEKITSQCEFKLPIGKMHYPVFPTPNGQSQSEYLRRRAYQGARHQYKQITDKISDRLDYELNIITEMGYEPIFLIVEDVLNHARQLGIPTSSRGSAASSLVAHCLNITSPDPLALNLYFERFLNPARKKPPDIDTDIDSNRRDEVIQYVFNTYGAENVAMVGTINRYRPKSALGDVAKAYGISPDIIRQLSKKLPSSFSFQHGSEDGNPLSHLLRERSIPNIRAIVTDASVLLDIPRHLSVHPGGIIIAPFPITDLIPLAHSPSLDVNHAQFDLDSVEKLGMVKIDLLGIRGLSVLGEVANRIQSWRISEYRNGLEVLDSIPKDDPNTSKTILNAKTIGCFQIESPGMRATLREIRAKNMNDIMAALALYRPGPLRGGLRDAFVRRFRGEEPVSQIHSSLAGLLDDTLGVILYQEQVLRIAHELGGLSIAQADILRRAMSHFDPGGVMVTLRRNFIEGAGQNHNVPADIAEKIWEMMAAFAGYGFPKAHAASYAQLAWHSAWCKTHFPAEFMSAVLGFGGGYYSQHVYLMEARRLRLPLNPPHINHARDRFCVKYPDGKPTLYMGLNQVRDLSRRTISAIEQNQPFTSLEDFILQVDPQKKEAQNLIMCGALEGLISIPQGLRSIDQKRQPGQMQLFSTSLQDEDWTIEQKLDSQKEILGVSLTMTPLEKYADEIKKTGAMNTLELQNRIGERVKVAGMRQTFRRFRSNKNQIIGFLTLEDLEGAIQIIIPAAVLQKAYIHLREAECLVIEGVVVKDEKHERVIVNAERIDSFP